MNALQEVQAIYAQWRQEVFEEGVKEGYKKATKEAATKEGLIKSLEALCKVLDIELTAGQRAEMDGWDIPRLERTVDTLTTSRRWPDA